MQFTLNHQHRTGLGGEIGFDVFVQIGAGFVHASRRFGQIKHPVGQKMKIARSRLGGDFFELFSTFHIEAHRRKIFVVHTGIHHHFDAFAVFYQVPPRRANRPECFAGGRIQHQSDIDALEIKRAYCVRRHRYRFVATGRRLARLKLAAQKRNDGLQDHRMEAKLIVESVEWDSAAMCLQAQLSLALDGLRVHIWRQISTISKERS